MERDKPEKTYLEIKSDLDTAFKCIAGEVANNANRKHPIVFTASRVSERL